MKPLNLKQNKKGNIVLIAIFIILLFVIMFAGFIMVVGSGLLNWTFDILYPELASLGVVGNTNFTEASSYTLTPLNSMIQSLTWLTGVLYVLMLITSLGFIMMVKVAPSKWLIGFYFMCVIILIIGSIFISNMYEEFYAGGDEFALVLKEHALLSWMILYSPAIFTVIAFLGGIILFSGMSEEGGI